MQISIAGILFFILVLFLIVLPALGKRGLVAARMRAIQALEKKELRYRSLQSHFGGGG